MIKTGYLGFFIIGDTSLEFFYNALVIEDIELMCMSTEAH